MKVTFYQLLGLIRSREASDDFVRECWLQTSDEWTPGARNFFADEMAACRPVVYEEIFEHRKAA
ncbi:MAG: hypothetical protein WCT40_00520 [Candidatus Magasanikbacteria bacterium]